jgi:choline/carnitine/betaine transport
MNSAAQSEMVPAGNAYADNAGRDISRENSVPWYERMETFVVSISVLSILAFMAWTLTSPDSMGKTMKAFFNFATHQFGWLYLATGIFFILFALWMAFGPYGHVKLGKDDEKPRFSFFSWFSMIFACGYGIGVVYWVAAEPLTFFSSPPWGIEGKSTEAAEIALTYAFFHWGWTPWAMYLAISAPIGYLMFRREEAPRFSTMLRPFIGRHAEGRPGQVLDAFLVMGTIFGIATSAGFGIMQLASGLHTIFGVSVNTMLYLIIAAVWFVIYTTSSITGIDKGIKILSNINIPLAITLMGMVLVIGPTVFIFDLGFNSFGMYVTQFFKMSFHTDPVAASGFPQGWTIFYWAWWIACAPATGMFIASISRGRTIKEVVLMHMAVAPVATWMWFATFGSTALHQQIKQGIDLVGQMKSGSGDIIFTVLNNMPMGTLMGIMFLVLVVLFLATTVDSFSYVCAQISTRKEYNPEVPPKPIRGLWAISIGLISVTLVLFGEGISGLQLSSIAASLLIIFVMIAICFAMVKMLKDYEVAK